MEYIVIIVLLIIIAGLFAMFKSKKKDPGEDAQTFITTDDDVNKPEPLVQPMPKKVDLVNKNAENVNTGSILGQKEKEIEFSKDKKESPNNWIETVSYEEDIKDINIDNILDFAEEIEVPALADKKDDTQVPPLVPVVVPESHKPFILLVDDSMVVRKYIGDLLKKNSYTIVLKNDGLEALNYLKENIHKPELIISDIEMPKMNGFELIDNIRQENKFINIPILVISANAESHLKLMESGDIQGFIRKPFDDKDLLRQIAYIMDN